MCCHTSMTRSCSSKILARSDYLHEIESTQENPHKKIGAFIDGSIISILLASYRTWSYMYIEIRGGGAELSPKMLTAFPAAIKFRFDICMSSIDSPSICRLVEEKKNIRMFFAFIAMALERLLQLLETVLPA